ncbi:MAG: alkaline phytoceramidase [Gammaproteobacteria bacterium HGW-Gammaproteobacteria-10]|nr:MAG: alkaline phytoceramidase [Gammaproteobacteria bacterium HGW-Gammaproteobacteria-10]
MMKNNLDYRASILIAIALVAVIVMFFFPAIPQDRFYHEFADQREVLGIKHFFNVVSNLPFILVGLLGVKTLLSADRSKIVDVILPSYMLFFSGVALVGIGSIYYHLDPNNRTLIWDRLPMTLAFMSFFSVIVGEYISEEVASKLLYPLLLTGLASVLYWYYSELQGRGDLRLYGLVQFLPLLLMPLILVMYKPRFTHGRAYWIFFGLYGVAKAFELADSPVYHWLYGISGHTLKHLLAALGCYVFLRQIAERQRLF